MRDPVIICGRHLGTCEGFDISDFMLTCYNFEPSPTTTGLASGDLQVDHHNGWIEVISITKSDDEEPRVLVRHDLPIFLTPLPREAADDVP